MLFNLYIYIVVWLRQVMKNKFIDLLVKCNLATIQEVSDCCKLLLMLCANASSNWFLAHFTTLLYFVSIILLLFGPRMYAESHWRYHTSRHYYTCSYPLPGYLGYLRYNFLMAWAIRTIHNSKYVQMDPQQLPKTSKFPSICNKCDMQNPYGGGYHPPLVAGRLTPVGA